MTQDFWTVSYACIECQPPATETIPYSNAFQKRRLDACWNKTTRKTLTLQRDNTSRISPTMRVKTSSCLGRDGNIILNLKVRHFGHSISKQLPQPYDCCLHYYHHATVLPLFGVNMKSPLE